MNDKTEIPEVHQHNCPFLAVDVIVEFPDNTILFINRKYEPYGLAIPSGHVDYGESTEDAARREFQEEVGLDVELVSLLGVYSDPKRDPRKHVCSVTYVGKVSDSVKQEDVIAASDALSVSFIHVDDIFCNAFAFDHEEIMKDYLAWRRLRGQVR